MEDGEIIENKGFLFLEVAMVLTCFVGLGTFLVRNAAQRNEQSVQITELQQQLKQKERPMIFVCPKCGTASNIGPDGQWHWCCKCAPLEWMNAMYCEDEREQCEEGSE